MDKLSVEAAKLNVSIICYMFERHRVYSNMITMIDGRDITIIEAGYRKEGFNNIYYQAVVELEGVRQMVNCAIFEDSSAWHRWKRDNELLAEGISMVIVGVEDDLVDRYSSGLLICVKCDVPVRIFKILTEITSGNRVLCAKYLCRIDAPERYSILSRYAIDRMEVKHNKLVDIYNKFGEDWSSRFVAMLFDTITISERRNRKYFNILSQNIGYNTIIKNLNTIEEVEALLFGASGMLNYCRRHDEYAKKLVGLYVDMKRRYNIKDMDGSVWVYKNRCVENNIHIIVAQLAAILFNSKDIVFRLSEGLSLKEIYDIILCQTSEYWFTHDYLCTEETLRHVDRNMSQARRERLIINGFVPYLFSYYRQNDMYEKSEDLISMLESIKGEDNKVLSVWSDNGIKISNALISQAILQINNTLCETGFCTDCMIGRKMIG